ncbi:hypothetical protein [Maribacter arcticus]|uniref:hypothetical protein n=1 Tax=Maribacter arcticus TaxID=561365 RepID=UPI0030012E47
MLSLRVNLRGTSKLVSRTYVSPSPTTPKNTLTNFVIKKIGAELTLNGVVNSEAILA